MWLWDCKPPSFSPQRQKEPLVLFILLDHLGQIVSDLHVTSPVDYPLTVQVLESTANLSSVEDGPLLVEARIAHVVDVEL